MTVEMKPTFIPADLHKWLKLLAAKNETTVQAEHEKALREAQALREQGAEQSGQHSPVAVVQ